jgi:hypothetical protein
MNKSGKSPGRPKGVPNKMTMAAKEAVQYAADNLGGAQRLLEWAQEDPFNEQIFWSKIFTKLLPLQAQVSGAVTVSWPEPKNRLDE